MSRIAAWLRSDWVLVRAQIGLGIVFVLAAWPKMGDPPTFAKNVWAYDILPDTLVNIQALILPGVEMVVGLALLAGLWPRAASLLSIGMLLMFMVALTWSLLAGNPVDCSCFSLDTTPKTCAQLLRDMKMTILRDVAILILPVYVLWARRGGETEPTDP